MKRIALIVFVCILSSCIKEETKGALLEIGDRIPDFAVTMNDGTIVTDDQLSEGVSMIVFFTTGCPDCRETLPHVQNIYDEYIDRGVSFALISREETSESIQEFWESANLTMPYSAQENRNIYELFAQTRVPRVYINKDGLISAIFTDIPQSPSYDVMKQALDNLFDTSR